MFYNKIPNFFKKQLTNENSCDIISKKITVEQEEYSPIADFRELPFGARQCRCGDEWACEGKPRALFCELGATGTDRYIGSV